MATLADHDVEIGNMSISALDINESGLFQLSLIIPSNTPGGNYSILAMIDSDEQIDEKSESDNTGESFEMILIDSKATSCPAQDDAMSGGDAGGDEADFSLLRHADISATINWVRPHRCR